MPAPASAGAGTARYMAGRAGEYLAVFVVALIINFALPRALPGGPLGTLAGESVGEMSSEQQAKIIAQYGLDRPLFRQFLDYLGDLLTLDLGRSFTDGRPVVEAIATALPWTLLLIGSSIVVTTVVGVTLGVFGGLRRERGGGTLLLVAVLVLDATPAFWLGVVCIMVFGVYLGVLPTFGISSVGAGSGLAGLGDTIEHLALPVGVLVATGIGQFFLVTRFSMLSVLSSRHVEHARVRGVPRGLIIRRYVLRPALLPVHTLLLIELGWLVGGALIVETVFAYPGLGRLTFNAIQGRDFPTMQGAFLVLTTTVLIMSALADVTYPLIDPRVRIGHRR